MTKTTRLAALLAWLPLTAGVEETIAVGETREGTLAGGSTATWNLEPGAAGRVTVALDSFDFDAHLAVVGAGSETLGEDADSGLETNAWLTLEVARNAAYSIVVTAADGGAGEYVLAVTAGEAPLPTGAELVQAGIEFRVEAAGRAFVRGDRAAASRHESARGYRLNELSRYDEALAIFESALEHARAAGARAVEADALKGRGNALMRLGQYDAAEGMQRAALAVYEELGDRLGVARICGNLSNLERVRGRGQEALALLERQLAITTAEGDVGLQASALTNLGGTLAAMGRRAEAVEHLEEALVRWRTVEDAYGEAATLVTLGGLLVGMEEHARARALLTEGLEAVRRTGNRNIEVTALANLAWSECELADYPAARDHGEEAARLAREVGDPYSEQWALRVLGLAFNGLAQFSRALEVLEEALRLVDRHGLGWAEGWVRAGLGRVYREVGRFGDARREYTRSLELATGRDAWLELVARQGLRGLLAREGRWEEAEEAVRIEIELAERVGRRRTALYARLARAQVARALDREALGRRELEEVLAEARRLDDRETEIDALTHLADARLAMGDYGEALDLCRTAGELARELESPKTVAHTLRAIAHVLHELGEYGISQDHLREALALARGCADRDGAADVLWLLGDMRIHLGDPEGAVRFLEEHLTEVRELGFDWQVASSLADLARAYELTGDVERAAELYAEAIRHSEERGQEEGPALTNLGMLRLELGQVDEGRALLERRLELARASDYRLGEAYAHWGLAKADLADGELDSAEEHLHTGTAQAAVRGHRRLTMTAHLTWAEVARERGDAELLADSLQAVEELLDGPLSHALDLDEASGVRAKYGLAAALAQDLVELRAESAADADARRAVVVDGFEASGRWKGRSLLEGIAEHRRGGRTAQAIRLRRERRLALATRNQLLAQVSASFGERPTEELDELRTRAAELNGQAGALATELERVSPRDAALELTTVPSIDAVREALPDDAVLVDYAAGTRRLYAYVLTQADVVHVDLGPSTPISALAERYRALVGDPNAPGPVPELLDVGHRLYEALLAPVLAHCGASDTLVLSPSPQLADLPFEALVCVKPAATADLDSAVFVLDRITLMHVPAPSVLVELASMGPRSSGGRVLVLADPRYPTEAPDADAPAGVSSALLASLGSRSAPSPEELARIASTRVEALALASLLVQIGGGDDAAAGRLLRAERDDAVSTDLFDLHLGDRARPALLRDGDLRQYAILHLAAHGYVDRAFPQRTGLALAFAEGSEGWFTVADALELDLDAMLVVLSACDTARGRVLQGDGVQSLARSFLFAGARAVVASLWRVDDRVAAETMTAFYQGALAEGLHPAAALRRAKLEVRRGAVRGVPPEGEHGATGVHPSLWAPFVYVGAPPR